jgi:broad specificity phosphatase PhoE
MTRVVAVRHGETDWSRNARMPGWAPTGRNGTGREQTTAAGAWLADEYDVDRAAASDLLGSRGTADLIHETSARSRSTTTVLLVTHGGPRHVLLGSAKGMPLREALGSHHQANCAVNEIRATGDDLRVGREKVTAWR